MVSLLIPISFWKSFYILCFSSLFFICFRISIAALKMFNFSFRTLTKNKWISHIKKKRMEISITYFTQMNRFRTTLHINKVKLKLCKDHRLLVQIKCNWTASYWLLTLVHNTIKSRNNRSSNISIRKRIFTAIRWE